MAAAIIGIGVAIGKIVLIGQAISAAIEIEVSAKQGMVGIDTGVDDHAAEALAAEGGKTGIRQEGVKIDQGRGGGIQGNGRSGSSRLRGCKGGEQLRAGGRIVVDDCDGGRALIADDGTTGGIGELQLEDFRGFRLAVVANADGGGIGQASIFHGQETHRLIGGEADRDRAEVEIVVHRAGRAPAAGGGAIAKVQGDTGGSGEITAAADPHFGERGAVFLHHIIGVAEVEAGQASGGQAKVHRWQHQGQIGGRGGHRQPGEGLTPATLQHLRHADHAGAEIIKAVRTGVVGEAGPLVGIQFPIQVGVEEHRPTSQARFPVVEVVAVRVVPDLAGDRGVIVLYLNRKRRDREACVAGVGTADTVLNGGRMWTFREVIVNGTDHHALG